MLGGDYKRMEFAAQFWESHKDLDIWVSDFDSHLNYNRRIFQQFGVPNHQLLFDSRATDTGTNFTFMVSEFTALNILKIPKPIVGANPLWLPINRGRHGGATPTTPSLYSETGFKHICWFFNAKIIQNCRGVLKVINFFMFS